MDQTGELRARACAPGRTARSRKLIGAFAVMTALAGCQHGAPPPTGTAEPQAAEERAVVAKIESARPATPAPAPRAEAPRDHEIARDEGATADALAVPPSVANDVAMRAGRTEDQFRGLGLRAIESKATPAKRVAAGGYGQASSALDVTAGVGAGSGGLMRRVRPLATSLAMPAQAYAPAFNTESYAHNADNLFTAVEDSPLSTFSADVDTASYSNVRRFLRDGQRPPVDAVRIEELINYFRYDYAEPEGDEPFSVATEVASAPWSPQHRLVRLGLRARDVAQADVPARNLVFLIDVSGSMQSPDKLPLLKRGLSMLVRQLRPQDRIAIAVYAGASGLALPPTPGSRQQAALDAIDALEAGGSTNGAEGIELAYRVAQQQFIAGGVNRVVLATDGDFNVGVTSEGDLVRLIEQKRKSGVFLTVLGFGTGNQKDATMEMLADKGNGHYAYIDSVEEARKVLVREAGSTLVTIAKDVKLQVEWNPARVASYRLIGYENRVLADRDFNDDKKDAGEIGAGHTVTALYEVVPRGAADESAPEVDALKYQGERALTAASSGAELLTVKLRYKRPNAEQSQLLSRPVADGGKRIEQASADLRWAAAVAGFGMVLRGSEQRGTASLALVRDLARSATGADPYGDRKELLMLVDRAARLPSDG
jgi:Ca-activated chloride channel family protein